MSQASHHNVGTYVDAALQATRGGDLQQQFLLTELARVSEYAADGAAAATLLVRFSKVDQHVVLDGNVAATLQLRCQRCLQPVAVDVEDAFNVVILPTESELDKLSESQDAIVSDPSRLDLAWLTEEQLLLAIPLVPLHATVDQCGLSDEAMDSSHLAEEAVADPKETSQRPFAALRDLMKKS